jgi:hypothetical protein
MVEEEGIEVIIEGEKYLSHPSDDTVLLNYRGIPVYLLYMTSLRLRRIMSIATERRTLYWQFDQLRRLNEGSYHLRKSKMIPGQYGQVVPRC